MDFDPHTHNLPTGVFSELSRLSDANYIIYIRNDLQNFCEIHPTGVCHPFTSALAAFIPNVVIKLESPLVSSIITAVPTYQGSTSLRTRTFAIVENLSDIVNVVNNHKAAFVREDATLAVWGDEGEQALAALRHVLNELGVDIGLEGHDLIPIVDRSDIDYGEAAADSNQDGDAFNEFIYNYDYPTDKSCDESAFPQTGVGNLLPMKTTDDADDLAIVYTVSQTNPFDSHTSDFLVLGDSTILSSGVPSDMSHQSLPVESVDLSTMFPPVSGEQLRTSNSKKRKRSPRVTQVLSAGGAISEKKSPRPVSRVSTQKAASSPLLHTHNLVSEATAAVAPASKPIVPPIPPSSGRSCTPSTSSVLSPPSVPKTPATSALERAPAPTAELTIPRAAHAAYDESDNEHKDEIPKSDDSGSEYQPHTSELELDELDDDDDDEYRPAKRTRSLSDLTWATSPTSVTTTSVRHKGVSPKTAPKAPKKAPKNKKMSTGQRKRKPRAKSVGPRPTCVWCDKEFTRESDMLRHEERSCKLYPFDRPPTHCSLCDKEISRKDAVIRHQESDECTRRQLQRHESRLV